MAAIVLAEELHYGRAAMGKLSNIQRFASKGEYAVNSGEGPEEELDSGTQPASGGRSRGKRVQGETARVPLPFLGTRKGTAKPPLIGFSRWWFMQLSWSA